ncbi:MAG: hypothetical protein ACWGQW_18790 [bacterium]
MTTKKDTQFSFEECFCEEMRAQMMPQSKGRKEAAAGCVEMITQFGGSLDDSECRQMLSRAMSACFDAGQESCETFSRT